MQAIILAAGMGKRLGELTKGNTKCMVKVNGVSLIDRVLTQLSTINLSKVIIVVGYQGKKLQDYLGNSYKGMPLQSSHMRYRFLPARVLREVPCTAVSLRTIPALDLFLPESGLA